MNRFLTLVLLVALPLMAKQDYDAAWLADKPKSYAKDLFILRLLEQNISSADAEKLYWQTYSPKQSHLRLFKQKAHSEAVLNDIKCSDLDPGDYLSSDINCVLKGFNVVKVANKMTTGKMSEKQIAAIAEKVKSHLPKDAKILEALASEAPIDTLMSEPEQFLSVAANSSVKFKQSYLNRSFPKDFIDKVAGNKKFYRLIKACLFEDNLTKLSASLLLADPQAAGCKNGFALSLLAFKLNDTETAKTMISQSCKSYEKRAEKDRALIFEYLLSGNEARLNEAAKSESINIYSIFAKEKTGDAEFWSVTTISDSGKTEQNLSFDPTSPFYYFEFKEELKRKNKEGLKRYAKNFETAGAEGYLWRVLERVDEFEGKPHYYYLMPYSKAYDAYVKPESKAFMLAISRQESAFIPSLVSSAYAIGVMQLIPELIGEIAELKHEKVDIFDFFKPEPNIRYATYHIQKLLNKYKNPLFAAYAYNAGPGYLNKQLKRGLFNVQDEKLSKLEPFYSMEMISYDETKDYGKRVLANDYVYSRLLGSPFSLTVFLKNLSPPSHTTYSSK